MTTISKNINLFRLKKENEAIKDRISKIFFKKEEEDYCKPVRVRNFYNKIYVEYESNCDRNKILSIKEYLKDIVNNLKKSGTSKIQLTIAINNRKSNNIGIMTYDIVDENINKTFESLFKRYQIGLKT